MLSPGSAHPRKVVALKHIRRLRQRFARRISAGPVTDYPHRARKAVRGGAPSAPPAPKRQGISGTRHSSHFVKNMSRGMHAGKSFDVVRLDAVRDGDHLGGAPETGDGVSVILSPHADERDVADLSGICRSRRR